MNSASETIGSDLDSQSNPRIKTPKALANLSKNNPVRLHENPLPFPVDPTMARCALHFVLRRSRPRRPTPCNVATPWWRRLGSWGYPKRAGGLSWKIPMKIYGWWMGTTMVPPFFRKCPNQEAIIWEVTKWLGMEPYGNLWACPYILKRLGESIFNTLGPARKTPWRTPLFFVGPSPLCGDPLFS